VLLEFLGLSGAVREADVEAAMVSQITRTLLELGDGLAFVGRQTCCSSPSRSRGSSWWS